MFYLIFHDVTCFLGLVTHSPVKPNVPVSYIVPEASSLLFQRLFPHLKNCGRCSPVMLSERYIRQRAETRNLIVPVEEAMCPSPRRFEAPKSVSRVFGPVRERPKE